MIGCIRARHVIFLVYNVKYLKVTNKYTKKKIIIIKSILFK